MKQAFIRRGGRQRLFASLWMIWAVVLFCMYYRQLWESLAAGFMTWDRYALKRDLIILLMVITGTVLVLLAGRGLVIGAEHFLQSSNDAYRRLFSQRRLCFLAIVSILGLIYLIPWHFMATGPWTRYFPAIDEAMSRAMLGFFGAGVVLLAAYVLGVGICRLLAWRPDQWREALLYHTTIGLGAVSYLSLGLALLGLYRPEMIKISVAGVILCGGLGLFWKFIFQKRATGGRINPPVFPKLDRPWNWVWKAVVVMSILAACIGALAPEVEFDSLLYHLTLPKFWLEQGGPVDIIGEYVSLYPMTWELIFGVGMVFGGPIAAKLLHFACLTLAALLVYQFTRHLCHAVHRG
jgi:hypothetical protein